MNTIMESLDNRQPVFNYHLLRNSLDSYQSNLPELSQANFEAVYKKASKSYELESLVMSSKEASDIIISDDQLNNAVTEIASRYESDGEFEHDLEINGLTRHTLRQALYRELVFNAVMQKVASRSATINDLDIRLFYELHRERFSSPEQRLARHILITINPEFPENTAEQASFRMNAMVRKLNGRANRFSDFAKRYSECPTAMEGGKLGEITRGQLYPELDNVLFDMQEGDISEVIETEIGLHILWCEKIRPAKSQPLSKVSDRIQELLVQRRRRNCQKSWLDELKNRVSGQQQ